MEKTELYHYLPGKWDWRGISFLFEGNWIALKTYEEDENIWHFRYDGIMVSRSFGEPCYCVTYRFDAEHGILTLDGYDLDTHGNAYARVYERYAVEFRGHDDLVLFDTEPILGKPAPSLRLHFQRK